MSQKKHPLALPLSLSCAVAVFLPPLLPFLHLNPFAPLLVYLIYRQPLVTCLWTALATGTLLDLLSPHQHLGLYATTCSIGTWGLWTLRRHFFVDKPSTLPILTFFFSAAFALLSAVLYRTFEAPTLLTWRWCMTDVILYPLVDAAYGFAVFIAPNLLRKKNIATEDVAIDRPQ